MKEIIDLLDKADAQLRDKIKAEASSAMSSDRKLRQLREARRNIQEAITILVSVKES